MDLILSCRGGTCLSGLDSYAISFFFRFSKPTFFSHLLLDFLLSILKLENFVGLFDVVEWISYRAAWLVGVCHS
jgi:hypothetical protein